MYRRPRLSLLALCALSPAFVILASCGGSSGNDGRVAAALMGSSSSPALQALSGLIRTGASESDAELLIVDGDSRAPGSIASDARIAAHLQKGGTLMILDLREQHKTDDVQPIANAARNGPSHAVLVRRGTDRHGRPEIFMLDFPIKDGSTSPSQLELAGFRESAQEFFTPPREEPSDFNPPAGLIYVIFNFSIPTQSVEFNFTEGGDARSSTPQYTSATYNYRYTLLLDNGQVATGDQQYLVINTEVAASALNNAMGTTQMLAQKSGNGFTSSDMGWFQGQLTTSIQPKDPAKFQYQTDSPSNVNQQTEVTTQVQFGINFTNPFSGGGGSYNYSDSDTETLTAWGVVNSTTGIVGNWAWNNQDPWMFTDPDRWDGYGFGGGLKDFGSFRTPNPLAIDQLVSDSKIVYATGTVLKGVHDFFHSTLITYLNVWNKGGGVKSAEARLLVNNEWSVVFDAVIPVPIQDITFSADPVNVRTTNQVTGTVVLERPAAVDTIVYLKSLSENATVLSSVTIPQGQSSAQFNILVNANNLSPGQSTTATIQAYNATGFQAQLTIQN